MANKNVFIKETVAINNKTIPPKIAQYNTIKFNCMMKLLYFNGYKLPDLYDLKKYIKF